MYETVHVRPDGTSTAARFALTAREQGYDGFVVRNHDDAPSDDLDALASEFDIDVIDGIEVRADHSQASRRITSQRAQRTIVCVHGGRLNRLACEDERVDVLAHPMVDGDFNHVLARAAADNGVRVEFNFARVLRSDGGARVQALRGLRKLRTLIEKYDVPYVVSADPTCHLHLRAPRELLAVGALIGFTDEQVRDGLEEWGRLATRNRDRKSESFIEPGVRRGRYEKDD